MSYDFLPQIDGYSDIIREIEVDRTRGDDYLRQRGSVTACVERYHPARLMLRVVDIIEETPSVKTFRLVSHSRVLPPFQAGQYIAVVFEFDHVRTTRAYSISSPPNNTGHYDITVRRVPDGLISCHLLDDISVGDTLETSGPAGNFHYNPVFSDKHMVCLAGGCGITPFMSIIREIVECGLDRKVHLFYGNQSSGDIAFHSELARIAGRLPNIHYIPVLERQGDTLPDAYPCQFGFITGDLLRKELGDLLGKTFYLCGPSAMYDFCGAELAKLDVPERKIRREVYGAPRHISARPGWPKNLSEDTMFKVTVNGDKSIRARVGESLLTALERAGFMVPSLCRSGECSLCRVRLLSGKVFQPEGVLLRASDRRFGYIHSCAAYPLEDLVVSL